MNAEHWLCTKPIQNQKVPTNTKCEVVCPDGHDVVKGELLAAKLCIHVNFD